MKVTILPRGCHNCDHFKSRIAFGEVIVPQCKGDPHSNRKWAPSVAHKQGRCGPKRIWWAKKA